MQFTMSVDDANKLYAHARGLNLGGMRDVKEGGTRREWTMFQAKIQDGVLTVEMIDGHRCAVLDTIRVDDYDEGEFWFCPPTRKFSPKKDGAIVVVNDDGENTRYTTKQGTMLIEKPCKGEKRFDIAQYFKETPTEEIYLNPDLLYSALSAYSGQGIIKLSLNGKKSIVIKNKAQDRTMILPMLPTNGEF